MSSYSTVSGCFMGLWIVHLCSSVLETSQVGEITGAGSKNKTVWTSECPKKCSCFKMEPPDLSFFKSLGIDKARTINCSKAGFDFPPRKLPLKTEVLYLNNERFTNLRKLPYIPNLIYLDISNNSIDKMEYYALFAQFKKLRFLSLGHNKLRKLDQGSFNGLLNLNVLDLSNNQLDEISQHAFAGLNHLRKFDVHRNKIQRLNFAWFEDMFDIRELDFSDNLISMINAKDFYSLQDLNELNLANNRIKQIDVQAFSYLGKLLILDLTNNNLGHIPSKAIKTLNLIKLNLNGNLVQKVNKNDFSNMNITTICISYMEKLVFIERLAFNNLPSLISIEAHDNPNLIYIDSHAFENVPKLANIYLHNDKLSAISPSITEYVPSLEQIHLYHNPLRCDCNSLWIKMLITEYETHNFSKPIVNNSRSVRCNYPLNLTGIPIKDVDEDRFSRVCAPTTLSSFKQENYTLDLGEELRLECYAYGVPEPRLSWLLPNGSEISGDHKSDKFEIADGCVLIVRYLTVEDSGTYECKSENAVGYDISSTRILVTNKPVRLVPFTVSSDYIAISWNGTTHSSMISDYQLHFRELKGGNSSDRTPYKVIPLGPQYRSYTVDHLKPKTVYEFCIVYVYDTELYKVDCKKIMTKSSTAYHSAIKKVISEKIIAGICTALGLIMAIACMVTLVKKFRFQKYYDTSYDADESETINIPLENVYQPLTTPFCSSKTSLLNVSTQKPGFDEY